MGTLHQERELPYFRDVTFKKKSIIGKFTHTTKRDICLFPLKSKLKLSNVNSVSNISCFFCSKRHHVLIDFIYVFYFTLI